MSIHIIPVNKLSSKALQGVIEEFISRDGTDYGEIEASPETNLKQVKYKLEKGSAILVFDDETGTTNIFLADNPILKKINTNLDSEIERGDQEEAMEANILVRRRDDDEGNKVI